MPYKDELIKSICCAPSSSSVNDPLILSKALDLLAAIREPTTELRMDMVILRQGGSQGGASHKPGNILLNWRRFFESAPAIAFAGTAGATHPWLLPFAALAIWNHVFKLSTTEISARDGVALQAMWKNRDDNNRIQKDRAIAAIGKMLDEYGLEKITTPEFEKILNTLSDLKCIEIESEEVWLREWMQIRI